VIRLADGTVPRDRFIERLYESGVGCSVHYIPLHLQPYWRDTFGLRNDMFPVSQSAYERMVSLPIYSKMTDEDVQFVIDAVRASLT
jgi:dTDP-4-amino-4,6-dideoxygalactose transaminase